MSRAFAAGNAGVAPALRAPMPLRPRALAMCALLPGCALPGCVTRELWREDRWRRQVHATAAAELSAELGPAAAGDGTLLVLAQRRDDAEMPASSGVESPQSCWRLVPRTDDHAAAALLAAHDAFAVRHAELGVDRVVADGKVLSSDATLRLAVALLADAVEVVDLAALPGATVDALRGGDGADLAPWVRCAALPGALAECAERFLAADPGCFGAPGSGYGQGSYVFVDAGRSPVLDHERALGLLGADFAAAGLPAAERIARLARLWLAAAGADGAQALLVRCDAVWLLAECRDAGEGAFAHTALFAAEPLGAWPAVGVAGPQARVPAAMRVRWRGSWSETDAGQVAWRVLLTPFALAADAVLGAGMLLQQCSGDDDEADEVGLIAALGEAVVEEAGRAARSGARHAGRAVRKLLR